MKFTDRIALQNAQKLEHKKMMEAGYIPKHAAISDDKLEELYELAWDYGHSAGWNEIELCYADFVALVLP